MVNPETNDGELPHRIAPQDAVAKIATGATMWRNAAGALYTYQNGVGTVQWRRTKEWQSAFVLDDVHYLRPCLQPDWLCQSYSDTNLRPGIDLETALTSAVDEIGVKELQFMATTLILQRRTGGQYAEVLENLSRVLRDRRAQYLKAKALTSESRVSARIVAIVTAVILVILAATNKAQFDFLFDDPLGHNLLIYAGVSIFIGFFTLYRLLRTLQ